jgi:spermidine/putrescine transport system permease protein
MLFYWRGKMATAIEKDFTSPLTKKKSNVSFAKLLKRGIPFAIGSTPFIWQGIFFYLPLFLLITSSFFNLTESGHFKSFTIEHFKTILTPTYFSVIMNSVGLAFVTTFLCLLIGFPLAYCIVFHSGKLKNFLLFLIIIPFWTNFILHIYAWFFVLEKHGFINNILLELGLISHPIHFLNTHFSIYLMMLYFYLPFMVLPIFSSLERFDNSLLEASLDLGANKNQTIRRILIPVSMNAIRSGIYLVFIPSFGEFVIPELMGGAKDLFIGNVISLFIMDHQTAPLGIAFTVVSITALLLTLVALQFAIKKLYQILVGEVKWAKA